MDIKTESVLIRKNTPELRQKLEQIGYKKDYLYSCNKDLPFLRIINTESRIGGMYPCYTDCSVNPDIMSYCGITDCGDDEEMFLELAKQIIKN